MTNLELSHVFILSEAKNPGCASSMRTVTREEYTFDKGR
jgi:hypothetical protein